MSIYEDDIDFFFDVFGVNGVYDGTTTVETIFDDSFERINLDTGEVEGSSPQVVIKTSAIANIAHGKTLLINSITYYIRGVQPDGTGMTRLILSKN